METILAFCLRCKAKVEPLEPAFGTTRNGRRVLTGNCPICYTRLYKLLPTATAPADPPAVP